MLLSMCRNNVEAKVVDMGLERRPGMLRTILGEMSNHGGRGECGAVGCGGGGGSPRMLNASKALTCRGCRAPGNQTGARGSTPEVE